MRRRSRPSSGGLAGFVLLILTVGTEMPPEAAAADVSVAAGNVLMIDGRPFRLWGISPPEPDSVCRRTGSESCATVARRVLERFLSTEDLRCSVVGAQPDRTLVGRCFVATADLGHLMVLSGWAVDDPEESGGFYREQEEAARTAPAGQWMRQ